MGKELSASAAWPLRLAATDDIRRMGFNVYRERLAPLEPWLRDVKQLVVVGPGMFLQGLPVEALVDSSGSWLGDRFVVSYAPSALLHAHSASTAASRTGASRRWRALVVGDPVPSSGVQPAGYPSLAAAQSEMRDLATLVDSSSVLLGAEASAERLRQLARAGTLERFQLVHFATHSAVDEVWLGQSALVLSGTDRDESARIRSDEISNTWRLDADLVTLAACRAIGGPASSLDGYLGLHQALLGAGARHLLASVWRVDDQATALLMGRFYRLLLTPTVRPMREAEALAQARRWLREWRAPDGSTPYAHPAHWASFVLFEGGTSATRSAPAARDHFTSTTLPSKRPPEFTTR
jgi:CHAT domain-containing protein